MRFHPRGRVIGALGSVAVLVALAVVVGGSAGSSPASPIAGMGTPADDAVRSALLAELGLETVGPPEVTSRPAPASKQTVRPKAVGATPTPKPTPMQAKQRPPRACPVFPTDNPWNKRVDSLPVASDSNAMIAAIGLERAPPPGFQQRRQLRDPVQPRERGHAAEHGHVHLAG